MAFHDRRRNPRVGVDGRLHARVGELDLNGRILDLSLGGFLFETAQPFGLGDEHEFVIAAGDLPPVRVRARCLYCRHPGAGSAWPAYTSGFRFLHTHSPEIQRRIHALMDVALQAFHTT